MFFINLLIGKTLEWHLYFPIPYKTGSSIFEESVLLTVLSPICRFLTMLLKNLLKVLARSMVSVILSFSLNDSFEKDFPEKNRLIFFQNCLLSFIILVSRFANQFLFVLCFSENFWNVYLDKKFCSKHKIYWKKLTNLYLFGKLSKNTFKEFYLKKSKKLDVIIKLKNLNMVVK